jgi:hypothetical protein
MLIPNQVMISAEAQANKKSVPRFAKPTDECKRFLVDHATDYHTVKGWEHHQLPASCITGRHFLDNPIPDPFIVCIKSHLGV